MIGQQSLVNSLVAYVQEETGARKRTLAIVERQEQAIVACDAQALSDATLELERELETQVERTKRRQRIFAAFAQLWHVPADALTLSSIAERAGNGAQALLTLRNELRAATAELARKNRRLAALATLHRRVVRDLIGLLAGDERITPLAAAGTLVDAEA